MSRAPLVLATLVVAAGIGIGLERPVPLGGGPLAFMTAILGGGVALLAMAGVVFRNAFLFAILTGAGLLLGSAGLQAAERQCAARLPQETTVAVAGTVEAVAGSRLRLRLRSAEANGARSPCDETVAARWRGAAPRAGAQVAGIGRWWRPAGAGGLRAGGVLMMDSLAESGSDGRARLAAARGAAARRLDALFGERAGLASSLLLAQRDGLDPAVRDRFARAGLSHLLAISGLHVGLVAGLLLLLGKLARLGKGAASGCAAAGTVAYVLFLGAPAAASRAALQVVFLLAAAGLQRPARSEALVAAAALILLAADPASLADAGFQLSFAGVAGLLALRRPLLRRMRGLARIRPARLPVGSWLADGIATGLAATIATAPIVAWHFGRVAPIGVLASLPAIPLVAALVPCMALALAAHTIWAPAGLFLAGAGGALLAALDAIARLAAAVPGGSVIVLPASALLWTAGALAGWLAVRRAGRLRPWVRGVVAAGAATVVLSLSAVRAVTDHLEIHMIDVGQGDAVAVRSPAGRWLLVDAGIAGDGYDAGARRVVPYLGARGVRRLEALILTHPHADHIGGAGAVVRALRPRWVGDPGMDAGQPGYLELLERTAEAGIPWVALGEGIDLELDGVTVELLHPFPTTGRTDDPNDISVVLRLAYGEFSVLLTGDAPATVELELVRRHGAMLEADVLKAGHHGSSTSTTRTLLQATGPTVALISAGRGNRYGHPHRAVLARLDSAGVRVLRTDDHGSVVVRGRADGSLEVRREREGS